jgi:hypothetical protein
VLSIEEHGGVIFLALTNHNETVEIDSAQELAHRINRGTIGAELVALANKGNGTNRSRFSGPHKLKCEVAIGVEKKRAGFWNHLEHPS